MVHSIPLYVFLGTKAQYIKTAPLLRRFDREGVDYTLIDSGQHGAFSIELRRQLSVREPDVYLSDGGDIVSIAGAAIWFGLNLLRSLFSRRWLRRQVFQQGPGLCIVHGDTPSTLLAVLMARLAGTRVAHIEAGLRSYNWLRPFPEEIIRVLSMKFSDLLFAPSQNALDNLQRMGVPGRVIDTGQNTSIEALYQALGEASGESEAAPSYAVMTVHRVETLTNRKRMEVMAEWAQRIARRRLLYFVLHEPTRRSLEGYGLLRQLTENPQISLSPLLPYPEFARKLAGAQFAITDGGSIQEECYYLGLPCLVARTESERPEGLGDNIVIGEFRVDAIEEFLEDYESLRRHERIEGQNPSKRIFDEIVQAIDAKQKSRPGSAEEELQCS